MTHDFDKDFGFSTTPAADALVRRACHRLVIDCCGVTRALPADDRRGIDYWVMTRSGRVGLDLKLRRKDYGAARGSSIDCVIELDGHGTSGWLLKAGGADLILFACADTNRVAMYSAKQLRTAVTVNLSRWLADGRAQELETSSHRNGRAWKNRAVIVSADTLDQAIEHISEAANGVSH